MMWAPNTDMIAMRRAARNTTHYQITDPKRGFETSSP
jgi:hypothetical protein